MNGSTALDHPKIATRFLGTPVRLPEGGFSDKRLVSTALPGEPGAPHSRAYGRPTVLGKRLRPITAATTARVTT